ncbi:ABC transporter permease [Luteococcus peritonei]|uniref:ABC transporter permease n=1 Tax=Luteococcus peritonei TaxID=88874 RepID=A0ABW4RY80_9ACTN
MSTMARPAASSSLPVTPAPADPVLSRHSSSLHATRHLVRLLAGPTLADRAGWALPVTAMAVVSALSLSVAGGVHWFWQIDGPLTSLYRTLSSVALVLLLLPLATLAAAAARLSASRRDTRLSSLRLLGATRSSLRLLTLMESGAMAAGGALLGVAGYAVLMPLLGRLEFAGGPIGAAGLWLGLLPVVGAVLGIVLLAVVSSAVGLHRVEVSPLGVRTRARAAHMGRWRALVAVGGFGLAFVAAQAGNGASSMVVIGATMMVALAAPLVLMNLVGPWLLQLVARAELRRARSAVSLLAARTLLEDPKQVWRQVGALALTSFVGVFMGIGMAMSSGAASNPAEAIAMQDVRTGVLLTMAFSFVTVACSVGVTQTAAVLDRRSLFVGLDMIGMPTALADRARRRAVMRPLLLVVGVSVAAALVMTLPMGVAGHIDLTAVAVVAGVLAAGVAVVHAGLLVSGVTLRQVVRAGLVRAE